ncbi:unnamed protein product [Calypogeia fissa]
MQGWLRYAFEFHWLPQPDSIGATHPVCLRAVLIFIGRTFLFLVVGESGLFTPDDIKLVQDAGVGAVLVGESLVKQDDPAAGIKDLFGKDMSRAPKSELEAAVA